MAAVLVLAGCDLWRNYTADWDARYSGIGSQIRPTADGGFVMAVGGGANLWWLDSDFRVLRKTSYLRYEDTTVMTSYVEPTMDGGYLVSAGLGARRTLVVKTDASGDSVWADMAPVCSFGAAVGCEMPDGGCVVYGCDTTAGGAGTVSAVRLTADGREQWRATLGESCWSSGAVWARPTTDGSVLMACQMYYPTWSALTISLDSGGNATYHTGIGIYWLDCACAAADGGCLLVGCSWSNENGGSYPTTFVRTDRTGRPTWKKVTQSGFDDEYFYSARPTGDGGFILAGNAGEGRNQTVLLRKVDSEANTTWDRTFGKGAGMTGVWAEPTRDGGFILMAASYKYNDDHDIISGTILLKKLDADGR
jgi:hypothetical protein